MGWQLGHKDVQISWQSYHPTISVVNKEPPKNINVDFNLFWKTWDLLSRQYIDKKALDPQKMFYGAISGMVSSLGDPYTVFLPPRHCGPARAEREVTMVNMLGARWKLDEAIFFLGHLSAGEDQERGAFTFYLSAFLNACYSVD